jgi:hypothetical protein
MHKVVYEFRLSRENVEHLVEDLGMAKSAPAIKYFAKNLLTLVRTPESTYCKVGVFGKPGLMLRFSKAIRVEKIPHNIEGAIAFIHPSSEGHLELEDFKIFFEASLGRYSVPYKKYG